MFHLHRTLVAGSRPLALAIGNFDGVHLGHQAILAATIVTARKNNLTSAAMSFEPMPREFFVRSRNDAGLAPARLMGVSEKLSAFFSAGIERAYIPRFDAAFAAQSPEQFIDALTRMNVRWLIVGDDFRFGTKRSGDVAMLRAAGVSHGFRVETMNEIFANQVRVSSTGVREALARGDLDSARHMLGAPYKIVGRVVHGKRLGRTLGFPTANISLGASARRQKPALGGVFAVKCRLVTRGLEGVAGKSGLILNGVANLGTNPVVSSENRHHLEVFLFDFSGDLYGRRLEVAFIEKIRDELKFASLDALVVQMHDDAKSAKTILRMTDDGPKN
jgi:riboflavin kinase/FMN adenylyltransferase